jgi:hypothetical protein
MRFGGRLPAYVPVSNRYHVCIETPDGRLAAGMQWLQSTFANRWFSETMYMGNPCGISKEIAQKHRSPRQPKLRRTLGTPVAKTRACSLAGA